MSERGAVTNDAHTVDMPTLMGRWFLNTRSWMCGPENLPHSKPPLPGSADHLGFERVPASATVALRRDARPLSVAGQMGHSRGSHRRLAVGAAIPRHSSSDRGHVDVGGVSFELHEV